MDKDITNLIERLELFEERLGVSLEGLYARWDGQYAIVTGELHVREGLTLRQNIFLALTAYDDSGRVMDTADQYFIKDRFYGFEAFKQHLQAAKAPTKIRIYPKAMV